MPGLATRLGAALLAALVALPAFADEASFTLGNPDKRLWRRQDGGEGVALACVHEVCPRGTVVTVTEAPGPAHAPSPAEAKRLAAAAFAESFPPEAVHSLANATIQGHPAVRARYPKTGDALPGAVAIVYLDGHVVTLRATSSDPAYAPRAIDAVLSAMTFRKGA